MEKLLVATFKGDPEFEPIEPQVDEIIKTPEPPYYAVIFTSIRTAGDTG